MLVTIGRYEIQPSFLYKADSPVISISMPVFMPNPYILCNQYMQGNLQIDESVIFRMHISASELCEDRPLFYVVFPSKILDFYLFVQTEGV